MYDLKVGFLEDENFILKRQLKSLKQVVSIESQANQRSLVFQLQSLNDQLSEELQECKDELLLEKQARQIENTEQEQIIEELNRCAFELKGDIMRLERIVREGEVKPPKNKSASPSNGQPKRQWDALQQNIDPITFFEMFQELQQNNESEPSEVPDENELNNTEQNLARPQSTKHATSVMTATNISSPKIKTSKFLKDHSISFFEEQESDVQINVAPKWQEERSSLYFMKQRQKEGLHLNLGKAKELQLVINKVKGERTEPIKTNVEALKRSYLSLIMDHEAIKKQMNNLGRYIQELESRNSLLLKGRLSIRIS